mmetsp:Transcript_100614/g.123182  ORF Transcript_100614/g.123182 Transcript_100614/m.123182 type:complete len:179 (+) Transcript_100614:123-659(+)
MVPSSHRLLPLVGRGLRSLRGIVSRAAADGAVIRELKDEVAQKFASAASGQPPSISTAQLVQMFFELDLVDVRRQEVGDVMNILTQHGFYCKTHPQKRDSYGTMPPPKVGLSEAQRWATLFFARRLPRGSEPGPKPKGDASRPVCTATWCQCPPGAAGTELCALYAWQNKKRTVAQIK